MTQTIYLQFQETGIQISTEVRSFFDFVTNYFSQIVCRKPKEPDIDIYFEIIEPGTFEKKLHTFIDSTNYQKLSRQIIKSGHIVALKEVNQFPGLKLIFDFGDNKLKVYGYYEQPSGLKNKLKTMIFSEETKLRLNLYLKYFLILFPCIWYNEQYKDRFLLHASAISYLGKTAIFPGLGGVGKSTLTLAFLSYPEVKFISDNLLLSDSKNIYSVFESIALDEQSIQLLGSAKKKLKKLNIHMSHARQYYKVNENYINQAKAGTIFFVKFCNQFRIQKISIEQAINRMISVNSIAKEVSAYSELAATLNLATDNSSDFHKYEMLKEMINQNGCYELCIRPHSDLREPMNAVLEILQNVQS